MAVAAFKSTTRRAYDVRGVEIEEPLTPQSRNSSPTRRRSMSRNPSPTRRSVSRNPSPTRRRSLSQHPDPSRRSVSRQPSPSRRSVSRHPSPSKRSVSRQPSPSRRSVSRQPSPSRRSVSRQPSPSRRSVSRPTSPMRRATSRGPASTPARSQSRPTSPLRRMSSTPQSRPTSPQKASKPIGRNLRRVQSFADLSVSSYMSDASTVPDTPKVISRQSSIGVRSSVQTPPSDSESEAEPRFMRRLDRHLKRDSSDTESTQSSRSSVRKAAGQRAGSLRRASSTHLELRRSLSQLELSDSSMPVYYQKPKPAVVENYIAHDDGEGQVEEKTVEEKTIQEVHTQTKLQTLCYNCLYDVSGSAEAASDFVSPNGVKIKVLGSSREAPSGEVDFVALYNARCSEVRRAVSDARHELENVKEANLRRELEAKLEESEKKVSELWSQYATEEQRCLHLVKSVKDNKVDALVELEPEPEPEVLKPQCPFPVEDLDETDFIRQSLDEEAARYFEECVIIANFDAQVSDDISVSSERESHNDDVVYCVDNVQDNRQVPRHSSEVLPGRSKKKCLPLDDEGMLLPWLDWEPEVDLGRKERLEKAVCDFREWKRAWARKSVEWGKSSNRERGKDEGAVNVDEFLFERTRLQHRIAHGRMIVCGGKR